MHFNVLVLKSGDWDNNTLTDLFFDRYCDGCGEYEPREFWYCDWFAELDGEIDYDRLYAVCDLDTHEIIEIDQQPDYFKQTIEYLKSHPNTYTRVVLNVHQ